MIGERFTRLVVVSEFFVVKNERKRKYASCICDCGTVCTVLIENLRGGRQLSCGCLSREKAKKTGERSKTHGMYKTRVYRIWAQMKRRCQTATNGAYDRYGKIGVLVCERWQKFENFFSDMGTDNGLTLDRIDPFGNYEPSNCRWVAWAEQAKNKRRNHGDKS